MKRFLLLIYILSLALFAHGNTLAEYSDITESYEKTHSQERTVQHIGQFFFFVNPQEALNKSEKCRLQSDHQVKFRR